MRAQLKNIIPNWTKALVRKSVESLQNGLLYNNGSVRHRSFIVTFHKCGSQWFKTTLGSRALHKIADYQYFAYKVLPRKGFDTRKLTDRHFSKKNLGPGIYGPLYLGVEPLKDLSSDDRICVIIRDPRNIITSWYDSLLHTHAKMGDVGELRRALQAARKSEGMDIVINHAETFGTFTAMEEWVRQTSINQNILIIKFEDVFSKNQLRYFISMMSHFQIIYKKDALESVLGKVSFDTLSKKNKHYNKGQKRDWRDELTPRQVERIKQLCPSLVGLYDN